MKKQRSMAAMLAAVTALTVAVSGCGGGAKESGAQGGTSAAESGSQDATAAMEKADTVSGIDGKGKKFVIAMQQDKFIDDYEKNYLTQKLEADCNIELEFYMLPSDTTEVKSKLSLMSTNASDMPDIIIVNSALSNEMILDYGSKGILAPLTDYINNEAITPNFAKIPEEDKAVMLESMTMSDGNIYSLAKYEPETWNLTPYRYFINRVWLEKLNLEMPTTTDELYEVLKAFVNEDPNGNGIKDEIGAYGYTAGTYGENICWALMNSFEFFNGTKQNGGLALDETGSKVTAPFAEEGWRKGLEYMHKLNAEGLLASSVFTDDNSQFKALLNADTPVVGLVCAGSQGNWVDVNNNPNFQELDIMAPLTGPDGACYTPYTPYIPGQDFFITTACEDPELACRIGDYFYDFNMSMTARYAEEGVDWSMDEAICEGKNNAYVETGLEDRIELVFHLGEVKTWSENNNKFWHNLGPRYAPLSGRGSFRVAADGSLPFDKNIKTAMLNAYNDEHYFDKHPENILPLLKYTSEESETIAIPIANIQDFLKTSTAEFVTGQRTLDDTGWSQYLTELESLGLSEWLELAQTAYDRNKE